MRDALGDGYTETAQTVHSDVGESSDFVMYWWNHAPELARAAKIQRFGFITTNSLRQTFNRRVRETHLTAKPPLSLLFAIPGWIPSMVPPGDVPMQPSRWPCARVLAFRLRPEPASGILCGQDSARPS